MLKELKKLISAVFEMEDNHKNLTSAEFEEADIQELDDFNDFLCNYYNEDWDGENVKYLMNLISSIEISREDKESKILDYVFNN